MAQLNEMERQHQAKIKESSENSEKQKSQQIILEHRIRELEEQKSQGERKLAEREQQVINFDQTRHRVDQKYKDEVSELKKQHNKEIVDLNLQIHNRNGEIDKLKKQSEEIKQSQAASLRESVRVLDQNKKYAEEIDKKKRELEGLQNRINEMQKRIVKLNTENIDFRSKVGDENKQKERDDYIQEYKRSESHRKQKARR